MGERAAGNVTNHVIDAVCMISKVFCPKDPLGLVRAVYNSGLQSLPNGAGAVTEQERYKAWSKQDMV